MADRSELLKQLHIDRDDEPLEPAPQWPKWLAAGALLAAVAGLLLWRFAAPAGVPVRVATARAAGDGAGASLLDAAGYVVARRQATVSAKITGKVTEVLIEEGRHVDAGQVVARLDDTNIRASYEQAVAQAEAAKAALAQVRVNLANAERDVARKQGLIGEHLISVADLDTAQTNLDALRAGLTTSQRDLTVAERGVEVARRNLDDCTVRAPFAGVITVKAAQPGEIVSPISAGGGFTRTGIGTIVDMDSLEVEVDVNENFIQRVHAGQPATIQLNAYPDWRIPAEVIAVIPTADRSKATVKVRVAFRQRDGRVLPEMGARVSFLSEARDDAAAPAGVLVPAEAVLGSGATGAVFLVRGDTVERRAVRLGARSADGQTVIAGLAAGDAVAIGDLARLGDGARVRVQP